MEFTITEKCFKLNGEDFFLYSAEMQYFRIKKEYWQLHILKIKEAGCNAICSYIPWDWHEVAEGEFDFNGRTVAERDLEGWLDLCQKNGLYIIVKPGPYILAEYTGAGIPIWFINKYREMCEVKNTNGEPGQLGIMSFLHPIFLDSTKKWYSRVMPIIKKRQISDGGNIIMMQVCNEVGLFTWLSKQADYSSHCVSMFTDFVASKYKDIEKLNDIYHTEYKNFSEVMPPSDKVFEYSCRVEVARDIDWHEFWRKYYIEYLKLLMNEIKQNAINLQFYHNLPGWIYGSGWEFPVNITMYNELREDYPNIILGVDHIPENVSYRNLHDDMIINEIVWAQQGGRGPLFAAEFQAGSREYCVVTFPTEMDLFYKASIANGLVGWNYYMFSSGKNPRTKGYFGPTFYWFTPLDEKAQEGSLYPVVKKIGKFIKLFGKDIVKVEKKSEICVLFYQRYYATELVKKITKEKTDIDFDPVEIRKAAYFDGLLKVLQILNIDFHILDIEVCSNEELKKYKQVWMFSCDFMDKESQQKLVAYAKQGGNLVVFPTLPKYDLAMKPCPIIRDTLNILSEKVVVLDAPKVDVFDNIDIAVSTPVVIYNFEDKKNIEVVLQTDEGEICGFKSKVGNGIILTMGAYFGYSIEEHNKAYWDIITSLGVSTKLADREKERLIVKQRFNDDFSILFVGNYYNEIEMDNIYYTHPVTSKKITISLGNEKLCMPPVYGFLSPINKKLIHGLYLMHITSDITSIDITDKEILFKICGNKLLTGEIAFWGENIKYIEEIYIDNDKLALNKKDELIFVNYNHNQVEQTIIVKMKK